MNKYCKQDCKCTICCNGGHISYWYAVFCQDCLIKPNEIPFSGSEKRTKVEFKEQMLDKIMKGNKEDIKNFENDLEKEKTFDDNFRKSYSLIRKFITEMFDKEYPEKDVPKWVDFKMFKNETILLLIESICQDLLECEEYIGYWKGQFMIPFYGNSLRTGTMSETIENLEIYDDKYPQELKDIPKERLKTIISVNGKMLKNNYQ